jgi:hypothetical protein
MKKQLIFLIILLAVFYGRISGQCSVNAGLSITICQGSVTPQLGGSFGGDAGGALWSDGGIGGTFTNNSGTDPSATTWTPPAGYSGSATLTLTPYGGSCTTESDTKSVTVRQTPNPSISGTTAVCINSSNPDITFTNPQANTLTVTYRINSGSNHNIDVPGTDIQTVSAPTSTAGIFDYYLVQAEYKTGLACTNSSLSGSATITVNPRPQGSLSANGPFCASGPGQLTWTATSGTGPFVVVYNDGTADRTATSVSSGIPFEVFISPVTSSTTYTLVSVTDINCIRTSGFTDNSATITINPLPNSGLTLSGTGSVCSGTGKNITVSSSQNGVNYQLRNDADNSNVGSAVPGTGSAINLPTGNLTSTTTFNVLATNASTGCSVELTETEIVTVNPLPQGSVTANGPICGSGTGQLTWTASSGTGPFTVVYNDGVSNRTKNSVTSGVPFDVAVNPVISTTTYTLVSVTDANCTRNGGFTGGSATIIVHQMPQGSLTSNGPFCDSGTGMLTWTATAGTGPFTVVYNDGTADRTVSSVTSGVAFNVFSNPVTSTTTYSLVSVADANCTRSSGFTGGSATITINQSPNPGLTLGGTSSICSGTGTNITVDLSQNLVSYQLRNNADNSIIGAPVSGTGGSINLPTGNMTSTRTFNVLATNTSSGCFVQMSELETVTVNPLPQGSLAANGPFCATGAGKLTWTATTGTGPYTIIYNDGTANRTASSVTSGVPFDVFTTPVTVTTTYNLVSVTDVNCTRNSGFTGPSATIIVYPQPQGTLSANGPFCASGTGKLTWTATAGTGPFSIIYNDGVADRTVSSVSSGVPFNVNTNPVTSTTTFSLVSVTDLNCTRVSGFTGPSATIIINPLPASITGSTSVCNGLTTPLSNITPGGTWSSLNPAVATVDASGVVTGVSGGTAEIRYTLPTTCFSSLIMTVNPTPVVTNAATAAVCTGTSTSINLTSSVPSTFTWSIGTITGGVTGATPGSGNAIAQTLTSPDLYTPGTLQYLITPTSTTGLCVGVPYTVTVSVNPLPRLTGASQSLTVCSGSPATINLFGLLPNTTSTISYEINNVAQAPVTGVASNSSGIASFYTTAVSYPNNGQLLRVNGVTTTSYTPSCFQGFIQDLALTIDPVSVGGNVTAVPAICSGATPADLNLTGVTGYVVKWQKSADAGFTSPIDIPFPTSPLTGLVIGPLTTGTYFRAVVKSGVCPEANSSGTLVTVNPLPVPVISGPSAVNVGSSGHVYTTDAGMNSYNWTISPGGTITSGAGTNSITVSWNGSGDQYVRVNYKNASNCTAITPTSYQVIVNARPVAVAVTIAGNPRSGLTLTGSYLYNDADGDLQGASAYQWYTNSIPSPAGSVAIPSATGISYTIKDTDTTKYLGFSVVPHALSGATPGNIAVSATWVGPVKNDPPVAGSVSIAGSLTVNSVLVGLYSYSDFEGDLQGASQFQWYSGSGPSGPFTPIAGETTTTHFITNNEQGKYFRFSVIPVAVTGKSPGAQVIVTTPGRVNSQPYADNIVITGKAAIDSLLTATWSYHDLDGDVPGASTFRWLRDGIDPVSGATGLTYKPTSADEGKTIVFEVTPVSATGFPTTGAPVKSTPTGVVIDASGNVPSAQEVCIQGNRRKGATLTGKYVYVFYKSEAGSIYRWLRNNIPIPGASGINYTLTDADIARGVDIVFEVTPVSSNYIPKVGLAVSSQTLSRFRLDKTTYSIADPPFKLDATVPGGFYSGKGVAGDIFDPGIADTIGSPHKITYQVTITNTVTVCPQQAYDSIYVFPIDPYFVGLDTLYCYYDDPVTISVANIPAGASDFKFSSPNGNLIQSILSDNSAIIDPSKKGKDPREVIQYSFFYKGTPFSIKKEFEIVYLEPAIIALDPGARYCNNNPPVKLRPSPSGSSGTGLFTGPVTGDSFDPSKGLGDEIVTYTYTDTRSGCFSSVAVPVTIYPAPAPAFIPVSTCIETVNKDITQFTNKTKSADEIASWDWKFYDGGGGNYGPSTIENPGYAFKIGGQHQVSLTATTINQCTVTKDSTIDIGIRPVIGFTWKNECFKADTSDADSLMWFFDTSTAPSEIKSWRWSFDGGPPVFNNKASFSKKSRNASGFISVNYQVETNYAGCGASITRDIYIRPTISLAKADYDEKFEGGTGGWVKDYSSKNSWSFGTPDRSVIDSARSGVNAWFTSYGMTGQTAENSAVISPCFRMDSVTRPMIVLWTWKRFDRDRDGAVLQYQVGDTNTWQPVGTIDDDGIKWFNSALITGNPGGKQIGWTAGAGNIKDASWVESRHILDELAGEKRDVKFRIAYGSDGTAKNNDGIAFDDIWIGERTRGVLLEHFTNANSSASPQSKNANDLVNNFVNSRGKDIINIQYHTNFPGSDQFYNDNPGDAGARFLFYGLSKAPFTMTDGGTDLTNFATVFNYNSLPFDTVTIIRRSLINPSFKIILNTSQTGGILNIKGEIRALEALNEQNLSLYLVVTEKASSAYPQPGEPVFYNVFRKLLPDAAGISLKTNWQQNEVFTIPEKTWTIAKIPNSSEIEVVAFIQNNITKIVYQAEKDTINNVSVGIESINSGEGKGFALYPNPSSGKLSIEFRQPLNTLSDIRIYDFAGTVVRSYRAGSGESNYTIEDTGLKNGIYLVRVSSGGTDYGFKKLIISGR